MPLSAILLLCAGTVTIARAQQPTAETCLSPHQSEFDVVSVKPLDVADTGRMRRTQDGITVSGTLRRLIQFAFSLNDFQVSGGPKWAETTSWEIQAKLDAPQADASQLSSADRQSQYERNMQQLQSALVERFHLKCHFEKKEMPVFDLVVAKDGPKLKETHAEPNQRGNVYPETKGLKSHAAGMAVGTDRIAILLSGPTGRFVEDKTGLTGSYDFSLDWVNDAPPSMQQSRDTPSGPSVYTAVEEQLGLRLVRNKGQVPVLVVDQAELPTQN